MLPGVPEPKRMRSKGTCAARLWFAEIQVRAKCLRSRTKVSVSCDDELHNRRAFQVWDAVVAAHVAHLGGPGLQSAVLRPKISQIQELCPKISSSILGKGNYSHFGGGKNILW